MTAIAMLDERADPHHPDAEAAIARWELLDSRKHPHLWIAGLYILATISLLTSGILTKKASNIYRAVRAATSFESSSPQLPSNDMSSDEILLFGDPSLSKFEQKEALLLSAPESPAFYAEYAYEYAFENGALPPDFLSTVSRIDPGNSFFPYVAAGRIGEDAVAKVRAPSGSVSKPKRMRDEVALRAIPDETEWEVTDATDFAEAMDLISRGAALDRFDTYETLMLTKRLELFPQNSASEKLKALVFITSQTSHIIPIRKVGEILSASAYLHSVEGDKNGFRRDFALSEAFLEQMSKSPQSSLVGELVYSANAETLTRALFHGASRLGLSGLEETLGARSAEFQEMRDLREIGGRDSDETISRHGSVLQSLSLPMLSRQVVDPPEIDIPLLTPGRLADHDFASGAFVSLLVSLLFLSAMALLSFRLRFSAGMGKLARRFSGLFDARDWAWIIGLGVVVPFAFIYAVSWLTPMGGRSWGLRLMGFIFPAIHFVILLLLLLSVLPIIIRWRMSKKLGAFGIGSGVPRRRLLLPAAGIIISLTMFPMATRQVLTEPIRNFFAAILVLWGLSICIAALIAFFGKKEQSLRRAISAHLLLPAYAAAIIIAAASLPVIQDSAERWSSKDKLSRVVPQGFNFIEAEIAGLKRKEVNAVLGFEN